MSGRLPSQSTEDTSFVESSERTKPSRELSSGASSTFKVTPPQETFEVEDAEALPSSERTPWLREKSSRYLRRHGRLTRVVDYAQGPRPPISLPDPIPLLDRDIRIRHFYLPLRLESTLIRFTRFLTRPWLFILLAVAYIIGFAFLVRQQAFRIPADVFTTCDATFWAKDAGCGLNGESCLPFDNATYEARCPAQCSSVELLNPRIIGDEEIAFQPLIVGGGDANGTYRGDSFICAAAIHAGMISNSKGGCFNVELTGNYTNFVGSTANGLTSIGFPSIFPLSFRVLPNYDLKSCTDLRTPALALNVIVTCLLVILLRPKPIVLYWSLVCIGYWHISLFSDPRTMPPPISDAFGSFLPALFVAYAFWRLAFRFVLPIFLARAPIETAVLYLGPWWVGVLSNRTFDRIPIQRLTPQDISKQPGGVVALIIVCIVLFILAVNQVRVMRKTGWLLHYAKWYICGGLVMMILALLPHLQFRLHHYILAMSLMPATAFPTRLSAIYQGVLLGLFLNGIAAYGFDSIVQTKAELIGDAAQGTPLPTFATNSSDFNSSIPLVNQTLSWLPLVDDWDGFALLVDDVERYVGDALNFSLTSLQEGIPHFFRLAFTSAGNIGDFTTPATLWPNGTWVDPVD